MTNHPSPACPDCTELTARVAELESLLMSATSLYSSLVTVLDSLTEVTSKARGARASLQVPIREIEDRRLDALTATFTDPGHPA